MAREPETRDRFRVFADVSSEQMGPLIALLARAGITSVGHELITDVLTFKKKPKHEISNLDSAMTWLKDHATFRAIELIDHFRAEGRSQNSGYGTIKRLVDNKTIRKLGDGNYQRSDVKAIAAGQTQRKPAKKIKPGKPAKAKRTPVPRYETSNKTVILKYIKNRETFTVKQVEGFLETAGRKGTSASPILGYFAAAKLIKHTASGTYAVNKAAVAKVLQGDKKPAAQLKKLNGQNPLPSSPSSESING